MNLGLQRAQSFHSGFAEVGHHKALCRQIASRADFVASMDNPADIGNTRVVVLLPFAPNKNDD